MLESTGMAMPPRMTPGMAEWWATDKGKEIRQTMAEAEALAEASAEAINQMISFVSQQGPPAPPDERDQDRERDRKRPQPGHPLSLARPRAGDGSDGSGPAAALTAAAAAAYEAKRRGLIPPEPTTSDTTCPICHSSFRVYALLQEHVFVRHVGGGFSCDTCSATFSASSTLRQHYTLRHNVGGQEANAKRKVLRRNVATSVADALRRGPTPVESK